MWRVSSDRSLIIRLATGDVPERVAPWLWQGPFNVLTEDMTAYYEACNAVDADADADADAEADAGAAADADADAGMGAGAEADAEADADGAALPDTGAGSVVLVTVAALLALAGSVALFVSRKRAAVK